MSEKKAISLRLDESILNWFKSRNSGGGYQTAINETLGNYIKKVQEAEVHVCGRAQEIFRQYYGQCFWHLKPDLMIEPKNLFLVLEGLRKYGGKAGSTLAFILERDFNHAHH